MEDYIGGDIPASGLLSGKKISCSNCHDLFEQNTLEVLEVSNYFFFKKEVLICKNCLRDRKLAELGIK